MENLFDDPKILSYLDAIINVAHDGRVYTPEKGIPMGSSLSPLFAAVYLSRLDLAFKNTNCLYLRYMDDIIILLPNNRSYQRAKKKVFKVLKSLKLTLSPKKSIMGKITQKSFHYLGLSYDGTQNKARTGIYQRAKKKVYKVLKSLKSTLAPKKSMMGRIIHKSFHYLGLLYDRTRTRSFPQIQVKITLHIRTCGRALYNIRYRTYYTGRKNPTPVTDQRYLRRWATWWHLNEPTYSDNIKQWIQFAENHAPALSCIGDGLLL